MVKIIRYILKKNKKMGHPPDRVSTKNLIHAKGAASRHRARQQRVICQGGVDTHIFGGRWEVGPS